MHVPTFSCALAIAVAAGVALSAQQPAPATKITGVERRITTDLAGWEPIISGDLITHMAARLTPDNTYLFYLAYYDLSTGTEHLFKALGPDEPTQMRMDVANGVIAFSDTNTLQVFTLDVATGEIRNIMVNPSDWAAGAAISESLVAWVERDDSGTGPGHVHARDLATGELRHITNPASSQPWARPSVSGRTIAWTGCTLQPGQPILCDVYAYDWPTATTRRVTPTSGIVNYWSPDISGNRIVYEMWADGDLDVCLFDLATGNTRRLQRPGPQSEPKISGDYVVFLEEGPGYLTHVELWSLKTDEIFDLRTLPGGPPATAFEYYADIDGNRIVYADSRDQPAGELDIYMYEFTVEGDTTPPQIALTGCPAAPVLLGSTHYVDVAVTDAESGVATQSPADGSYALQTATVGPHTFTADATDNAGNVAPQAVCAYTIIYDFEGAGGFGSPIADPPAVNSAKAGSAVPVKFKLPDGKGGFISDLGAVASITVGQVGSFDTPPASEIEEWTTGESGLKYDAAAQQFIYIWKTEKSMAGQSFVLTLRLADGTAHTANFTLR